MRELGRRLQDRARQLWRWLFPERIELPEEVARLVAALYPALDLGAVRFHRGLPHLVRLLGSQAITIPAPLARRRTCIYVEPASYDPTSVEGIGTLLHEAYHALQVQEAGWGVGPFRPFLLLYFAAGAANGFRYRGHPMEEAAYLLAGRRHSRFESAFPGWRGDLTVLEASCRDLAAPASGLRFWRDLALSVPFVRRPAASLLTAVWLLVWSVALVLAWLGWLGVAVVGAGAAAVMWALGAALAVPSHLSRLFARNLL